MFAWIKLKKIIRQNINFTFFIGISFLLIASVEEQEGSAEMEPLGGIFATRLSENSA